MDAESLRRFDVMTAELRQANEQLLHSALREQEWAEEVEAARLALERANQELERRVAERTAELVRMNTRLADEIVERQRVEAARSKLVQQLIQAEEGERRRISRELHDHMGQQLTGLLLGLRAAQQAAQLPELEGLLRGLERTASETARDVQNMAVELRPPALDTLGLAPAVQDHLEGWSARHGIEKDFDARGLSGVRLSRETETTIYRVVQEGLTNVLKHAKASRVAVILERRDGLVRLVLEDDGEGFDVEGVLGSIENSRRLGLRGMRERVALLRGDLQIESSPGSGTTLFVRVPAPEEELCA